MLPEAVYIGFGLHLMFATCVFSLKAVLNLLKAAWKNELVNASADSAILNTAGMVCDENENENSAVDELGQVKGEEAHKAAKLALITNGKDSNANDVDLGVAPTAHWCSHTADEAKCSHSGTDDVRHSNWQMANKRTDEPSDSDTQKQQSSETEKDIQCGTVADRTAQSLTSESGNVTAAALNHKRSDSPFRTLVFAQEAMAYMSRRKKNLTSNEEFVKRFSMRRSSEPVEPNDSAQKAVSNKLNFDTGDLRKFIFHPYEPVMFIWLTIVSVACLYNLWSVIARQAFDELNKEYASLWRRYDIMADLIYLFDIFVQFRTGFLKHGMMVFSGQEMAKRYLNSQAFVLDLISIGQLTLMIPNSLITSLGRYAMLLRCVRFVKVYRALKWSEMIQNSTRYPNVWRVTTLTHFLLLGCHWFAAFYYMISEYESHATEWTYPPPEGEYASLVRKYLICFSWSVRTLTNVGADKTPETNLELTFTILCFLLGLYVFAAIVGQVSNVVMENYAHRMQFEKMLDTAKGYMQTHEVPVNLQTRVIRWYEYMWLKGGIEATQDVNALHLLPEKLKTEISIFVHSRALQKVTIFQKCRPEFLHSLVLKMQMLLSTPGDYICRKGEVAKEMFIIIEGIIEVLNDSGKVLKQMVAGDFFGEIGILNLHGGLNRRTADVRSLGYSQLFVLSRDDVLEALKDDAEAEAVMREYAKERLKSLNQSQVTPASSSSLPSRNVLQISRLGTSKQSSGIDDLFAACARDSFEKYAEELKLTFSRAVDQLTSSYRERIAQMESKMRELESETQKHYLATTHTTVVDDAP